MTKVQLLATIVVKIGDEEMKFYHVKTDQDLLNLDQNERSFILCDQEKFKHIYESFNIMKRKEEANEKNLDTIHFESHFDYDVTSFSFFEWQENKLEFEKVYLYFSKDYLIFVCNQNETLFNEIVADIEIDKEIQPNGIDTLTYAYYKSLDHILAKMFVSLENSEQTIADLEMRLLEQMEEGNFETIMQLKSMSFEAKRHLRLLTYIGDQILSNDNNLISEENLKYFKNISTKMSRLYEFGSSLHEKADHLLELYNTSVSEKSNGFLNKLTIITVFTTPIAIFSGIYGMNFVNIPELKFEYGYFVLLGVLLAIITGSYFYLKKSKIL